MYIMTFLKQPFHFCKKGEQKHAERWSGGKEGWFLLRKSCDISHHYVWFWISAGSRAIDGVGNEGVRSILRITLCLVDDRLTLAQHNWIAGIDFIGSNGFKDSLCAWLGKQYAAAYLFYDDCSRYCRAVWRKSFYCNVVYHKKIYFGKTLAVYFCVLVYDIYSLGGYQYDPSHYDLLVDFVQYLQADRL